MAVEPPEGQYESEWRYTFEAVNPSGPHVVFSGSVRLSDQEYGFSGNEVYGTADDSYADYDVHLVVGPYWRSVVSVVPFVTIHGFIDTNADQDDEQGWRISNLTWDAVSGTGAHVNEERIRLKFTASVIGEEAKIFRIGYWVFARGRQLGQDGLMAPPPAWPNP
jgi:hypothetical protein